MVRHSSAFMSQRWMFSNLAATHTHTQSRWALRVRAETMGAVMAFFSVARDACTLGPDLLVELAVHQCAILVDKRQARNDRAEEEREVPQGELARALRQAEEELVDDGVPHVAEDK